MAVEGPLLSTIKDIIYNLGGDKPANYSGPTYIPPPLSPPHVMCCHVSPPPICAPTCPEPVKPLRLPCQDLPERRMNDHEAELTRFDNFYNNYNIDWKAESPCDFIQDYCDSRVPMKCSIGVTVDGKLPCIPRCRKPPACDKGCPTGFKPCKIRMIPPCDRHPCGLWCGEVLECPPKSPAKVYGKFVPSKPCGRLCCIHTDSSKCKSSCYSR